MLSCKVTVIIPVFNSSTTIQRAIESVKKQSFKEWSLIIVNDGSTDNTALLCGVEAEKDKRIAIVEQQNSGPAVARNNGLDLATSEYVAFLDADDTYDPLFLETMVNVLEESKADFAICGFDKICLNQVINVFPPDMPGDGHFKTINSISCLKLFFKGCPNGIASLWNKVYRLNTINKNNVRLEPHRKHGEDWKFNLDLITSNNVIGVVVDRQLYHYYDTDNSLTKNFNIVSVNQAIESAKFMLNLNSKYELNYEENVYGSIVFGFVTYVIGLCQNSDIGGINRLIRSYKQNEIVIAAFENIWNLPIPLKLKFLAEMCSSGIIGVWLFKLLYKFRY